ncbi:MAG: large conductance mechanosensitive channel protein MscL [Acidobacteriota bacterium]
MLKEFKEFIAKGNILDLAVAVVIGGAFGKIVASLVDDVIMPPIGKLLGNADFANLYIPLAGQTAKTVEEAKKLGAVIAYGAFLNTIIQFLIIAFVIFLVVKAANRMKRKQEEAPAAPSAQEVLLAEIRDLLKAKN